MFEVKIKVNILGNLTVNSFDNQMGVWRDREQTLNILYHVCSRSRRTPIWAPATPLPGGEAYLLCDRIRL